MLSGSRFSLAFSGDCVLALVGHALNKRRREIFRVVTIVIVGRTQLVVRKRSCSCQLIGWLAILLRYHALNLSDPAPDRIRSTILGGKKLRRIAREIVARSVL